MIGERFDPEAARAAVRLMAQTGVSFADAGVGRIPRMATGEHDFEAELTREAREQAESDQWAWSTQVKHSHEREWAQDWQYARLWRFVPRPADHSHPAFEPFGPEPLEGAKWELNIDRGDGGVETSTPAQVDVLMQLTYWRRPSPGMMPGDRGHVLSAQYV